MRAGSAQAQTSREHLCSYTDATEIPLDLTVFNSFHSILDPLVLAQIYREFLASTRERAGVLGQAPGTREVLRLAHTIKGTAGMLGAKAIEAHAERLDRQPSVSECVEDVRCKLLACCTALEDALRKKGVAL